MTSTNTLSKNTAMTSNLVHLNSIISTTNSTNTNPSRILGRSSSDGINHNNVIPAISNNSTTIPQQPIRHVAALRLDTIYWIFIK